MPKFNYTDLNFDLPPAAVYVSQVIKAEKQTSQKGNTMIACDLRTLPDGYSLRYFLVFNGTKNGDGLLTQFCKHCEGELTPPSDPDDELSLTAADCLHRICFIDVVHEGEGDEAKARIKFAGILARAKAFGRAPELASIPLPANVPPPRQLAAMPPEKPKEQKPSTGAAPLLDDDIPFAPNCV